VQDQGQGQGPNWLKNGFIWLILIVVAIALMLNAMPQANGRTPPIKEDSLNAIVEGARSGTIDKIIVGQEDFQVEKKNGEKFRVYKEPETSGFDLIRYLQENGVSQEQLQRITIQVVRPSDMSNLLALVGTFLPVILIGAFLLFMLRQAQGANNQAIAFGKSRAKMFASNKPPVTFADVAGEEEAKQELQEVVEFLKYPDKFTALGARIPKGVLLVGPPGVGKTLLARAVAGEAGVPFFSISGSEFVEMFVGVGASRVRDLFDQAKKNTPCIVFIDELDAVGRHRGAGLGGSHDEREQTLNQILVEMDGFDTNTNVIILAATNRPDILDPALLRPGRFDRQVILDRPDINGRKAILEVHAKGKPLSPEVSLEDVARGTPGFSGADLANLINEAAILSARRNKKAIGKDELQEAVERVIAGPEKRSRVMTDKEKEITAYHEAGHGVVAKMLPFCDPVHKITIIPRGMAGGYTLSLPPEDRHYITRSKFMDDLAYFLGGHAAEELVFNDVTTGSQNDLQRATEVARRMVCEYGMSERLGPRTFGKREEMIFLGREITEQRNYSEEIAQAIDDEVRRIIDQAYTTAKEILTRYRAQLDQVAQTLIKEETIDAATLDAIFGDLAPKK